MSIIAYGFVGKVWGNGQFGVARCKEESLLRSPSKLDASSAQRWRTCVDVHGVQATLDFVRGGDEYISSSGHLCSVPVDEGVTGRRINPIGLSQRSKSHRRGTMGITAHGVKVVRNAAKALQDRYGRSRLSFVTLTVPGMTQDELRAVSDDWQRIVKVFVQKLKRSLIAAGLSGEVVGVTEIQEDRLGKRGELALHLHLLFQGAVLPWKWAYGPVHYREMWLSVLDSVVSRDRWSSGLSAEKVHSVRFSAEGYLGKYMSKGSKNLALVKEKFPDVSLPSAWWICTFKLRRHVLRNVCHVSSNSARYLLELIETCPDVFDYLRVVRVRIGERDIGVGYCGKIAPDRLREIRETLYALKEDRYLSLGMGL